MKVLLVYPPNQLMAIETPRPDGSLGPLYLAGALEANDIECDVLDCSVGGPNQTLEETFYRSVLQENGLTRIGMSEDEIAHYIAMGKYDVVGISSNFTPQTKMALEVAKAAKQSDCYVIAGGVNARNLPERFLRSGYVDQIVLAEGEQTICDIVDCLAFGFDPRPMPGTMSLSDNGSLITNKFDFKTSSDLDYLPMPRWEKLPFEKYEKIASPHGVIADDLRYASIMTSRGCPFQCAYCLHSSSKIVTREGLKTIKWIVDNRYQGEVLSLINNKFVWNKIIEYSCRSNPSKQWIKLLTSHKSSKKLICTEEHECAIINDPLKPVIKYSAADETVGKWLVRQPITDNWCGRNRFPLFNSDQLSVLFGLMMGDGCISKKGICSISHSKDQLSYLKVLQNIFGGNINNFLCRDGYGKGKMRYTLTFTNAQTKYLRQLLYNENGVKRIGKLLPYLTPVSLAFWYLDDGSYHLNNKTVALRTDGFNFEDNISIQKHFDRLGIKTYLQRTERSGKKISFYITLAKDFNDVFFKTIAPFVPKCMEEYIKSDKRTPRGRTVVKLPSVYRSFKYEYDCKPLDFSVDLVTNIKYLPKGRSSFSSKLYDIEVENAHNFIANEVVVHNCHISTEKKNFDMTADIGNYRVKSVERVLREIEVLQDLKVKKLYFEDDSLLAKKSRVKEIFNSLLGRGLKIAGVNGVNLVHFQQKVDGKLQFDRDYLELLSNSGFKQIVFPVESASQRILDKYATAKLDHRTLDVVELVKLAVSVGITCPINMMIGFPDETREEILSSIELGRKLVDAGAEYCTFFIPIPFPGSQLYHMALAGGHLDADFDTDIMNWKRPVMKNTIVSPEQIEEYRDWGWETVNSREHVAERLKQSTGERWKEK